MGKKQHNKPHICFPYIGPVEWGNPETESRPVVIRVWASLVAQRVKNLPAMQETQVRSLGQEDPLEKEMKTHSSILTWEIPWTEEPGRLQSVGSQESDTTD